MTCLHFKSATFDSSGYFNYKTRGAPCACCVKLLSVCVRVLYWFKRLQAVSAVLIILRCICFVIAASLHFIIYISIICGCHGALAQPPSTKIAKKKKSWSHLLPAAQTT